MPVFYFDTFELLEATCLGVDLSLLVPCTFMYFQKKYISKCIQEAVELGAGFELVSAVEHMGGVLPYAIVSGTVKAMGSPLLSQMSPGSTGVIKRYSVIERYVSGSVRQWIESERLINSSIECVDFVLKSGDASIVVKEPLRADRLDLVLLSDRYEPRRSTFVDILWEVAAMFRLLPGGRQLGLRIREEMLVEGSSITAVGELRSDIISQGLQVKAPESQQLYVLSRGTPQDLKNNIATECGFYKMVVGLTTLAGVCMATHMVWRRTKLLQDYLDTPPFDVYRL